MDNKVLIIAGMHRSGTSLTANWLDACGLAIGTDVSGPGTGNIRGHFEDRDFFNLHEEILKYNETDYLLQVADPLVFAHHHFAKAKALVNYKNEIDQQWGWKEPRTTLFLDEIYSKLLPEANYLVLFRHFNEVTNSLFQREMRRLRSKVAFPRGYGQMYRFYRMREDFFRRSLEAWIHYNSAILRFISKLEKDRYLLVEASQLPPQSRPIYDQITRGWGFDLEYVDLGSLFDETLFTKSAKTVPVRRTLRIQADEIFLDLQRHSTSTPNGY